MTVTAVSVNCVLPIVEPGTYGRLSLTVSRKFSVLEIELRASIFAPASPPASGPVTTWPANMVESLGKSLVPDVVAGNVIQFGPVTFVGEATLDAPVSPEPRLSFCSQV